MSDTVLEVKNLVTTFRINKKEYPVIRDISFEIHENETLCMVGESGCGKSVTTLSVMGLLPENGAVRSGSIKLCGEELLGMSPRQLGQVRGKKMGMIFQEPMTSLNPLLTIGYQLTEGLRQHLGMSKAEAHATAVSYLEKVGIANAEERMKQFPFQLSGGLRQRIMIAMMMSLQPRLLIADEPTTALDVTIQHQILKQMRSLQEEYGTSIIFITHDLGVVAELCDRVVVLYGGLVMEEAEINDLFENPLHPYTMGLLASIPGLTKDKSERLQSIPGSPPDMTKPPKGCPFASRCQFARNICAAECPPFVQVGSRQARCWLLQPDAPAEGNPLHEKLAEAERKAH